jgi:hypothetical protein
LPKDASEQLPSRGMVMVEGAINGYDFQAPLEPDGKGGHWLKLSEAMQTGAKASSGGDVTLVISPSKQWPEPDVPTDLQEALAADSEARAVWLDITPMARWDWIRWIRNTKNPTTRQRRVEVTCSKLTSAKRRPCCFNRSECTDPEVSKGGILLEPTA